jgi:hypothetical protein
MPNRDATGPMGMGRRTGRGMGFCGGGLGRGRYFGRGLNRVRSWIMNEDDKKKLLKEEAQYLKDDLREIEKELGDSDK